MRASENLLCRALVAGLLLAIGLAAATPVALAAASGPAVTGASCVGSARCGQTSRTVAVGGRLALQGRRLAAGMTVVFAGASRRRPPTARLRRTRHGLVVTVPPGARTGRIVVVASRGRRSRPFGPITIVATDAGGTAAPGSGTPTGTAFDGAGIWIWYLSKSAGGDLDRIAAAARKAGVTTLYVKSSDGSANYWSQFSPALVQGLHQRGLRACAWQYVYGTRPSGEAALGAQAVSAGADCLVIDAEAEYEGKYAAAQTYIQALRSAIGPNFPVGLASFPYVDYHSSLPYSVFLGPGAAQFNLPQMYWHEIGTTVDRVYSHTFHENRLYARPVLPLGQTYGGTPTAEIYRFRQLAQAYGTAGLSWWDWQETTTGGFAALARPLAPASVVAVDRGYPRFSQGAKGDQVVWMQEHLAAARSETPTTGAFDAATAAALTAFQASRGLPQTGVTDLPTWQALLALPPVTVNWSTAARRR